MILIDNLKTRKGEYKHVRLKSYYTKILCHLISNNYMASPDFFLNIIYSHFGQNEHCVYKLFLCTIFYFTFYIL